MENPDLRLSMGMEPDQKGVRIRRIEPTAAGSHVLKPSDVILSFDGVNIANDGTGKDLVFDFITHMLLIHANSWIICCVIILTRVSVSGLKEEVHSTGFKLGKEFVKSPILIGWIKRKGSDPIKGEGKGHVGV